MDARSPVVRNLEDAERPRLRNRIEATWGLPVVSTVTVHEHPEQLEGVVGLIDGRAAGVVTYDASTDQWEAVSVEAMRRGLGVGRAMMLALRERAARSGASRLWLITTDTNIEALAFYDRIGMRRARIHENFVERVRKFKPDIPGDPFRDAIEFEWTFG